MKYYPRGIAVNLNFPSESEVVLHKVEASKIFYEIGFYDLCLLMNIIVI